jgi:1,4-alpha-glucan branching enzyme
MLKKRFYQGGNNCRVWFYLPSEVKADSVHLVGDFNYWDENANPMKVKKDGTYYTALTLETGRDYQFRYLLDNKRWENDWEADAYVKNESGTENSVIQLS